MVMQKVVYYVSLFSTDVNKYLAQMRSKDMLVGPTNNKKVDKFEFGGFVEDMEYLMIDLDEIP